MNNKFETFGEFGIDGRQIQNAVKALAKQVVQTGYYYIAEVILYLQCRIACLPADY